MIIGILIVLGWIGIGLWVDYATIWSLHNYDEHWETMTLTPCDASESFVNKVTVAVLGPIALVLALLDSNGHVLYGMVVVAGIFIKKMLGTLFEFSDESDGSTTE
ncbi:MAG: hypothetical protein R3B38_02095 [Patescibacteria group bacterium]